MLTIKEIIKKYNILAKKSFGQNFLMNEEVCKKIADLGEISTEDFIIEVGPGLGSLTKYLISHNPKNLLLIEKDKNFKEILEAEYLLKNPINIEDALKFNFAELEEFKVLANLPYNVGTELLTNWVSASRLQNRPQIMVLMLQKEVVERIIAKPKTKDYGRLSVLCQAFYECEKCFDVSPSNFSPQPNVTSSVVKLVRKNVQHNPQKLGEITKVLFASRRKILKNALLSLNIQREDLAHKRAEELSVQDFLSLL